MGPSYVLQEDYSSNSNINNNNNIINVKQQQPARMPQAAQMGSDASMVRGEQPSDAGVALQASHLLSFYPDDYNNVSSTL